MQRWFLSYQPAKAQNDWPEVFKDSRRWCYLSLRPSTEPVKALVESFVSTWQFSATDPVRSDYQHGWIERLRDGKATLSDLIEATERRRAELDQAKPPAFFLYVDQGEELYVRAEEGQRRRFSQLLVEALADPRLRTMMSMRADFLGALQSDRPLFKAHRQINVPPLGEDELREVISRPAKMLGARFEPESLIDIITNRTVEDSLKEVGALPLLSYTLDDMWRDMGRRGDGLLRLPAQSFELGGVLVGRANSFLAEYPGAEEALRRVFTLRLATVREDGEPTRRRAARDEFSDKEWRLVSDLADYPNRLLVTATTETGEIYAEVAHEAIFRRWDKLKDWIVAEREFLAWRSGLEAARRAWQAAPQLSKDDALLMGFALGQAKQWVTRRPDDVLEADRQFIEQSGKQAQKRLLRIRAPIGVLVIALVAGLAIWWQQDALKLHFYLLRNVNVLTAAQEKALKPRDSFQECTDCPEMVVLPAGKSMGSPPTENGRFDDEGPNHEISIAEPFAVSRHEVTFDRWETCVQYGPCARVGNPFGGGKQPAINVSWGDAQVYVKWLSKLTDQRYRLLTEAQWEYAARAVSEGPYSFEGDESALDDYAWYSKNSDEQSHPVGQKKPNGFGLHDMHGNVWEWVEDCYHENYDRAPSDGSAWTTGDCNSRVVRGGSYHKDPRSLRSANRGWLSTPSRGDIGFRVGRTLTP